MTSASTFPQRFTEIDDLSRADHAYLTDVDRCYFIGEYTARRGFSYSSTNNLILNFKKPMDRRRLPEWRYKEEAIATAAAAFRRALRASALERLTFVSVPPSKAPGDVLHDDRLTRMLWAIRPHPPLDVRDLITQTQSTEAAHRRAVRLRPDEVAALYRIDEALTVPAPGVIAIVDDLLTTGAHFRASSSVLSARFPDAYLVGLFIARRVPETAAPEEFDTGGN